MYVLKTHLNPNKFFINLQWVKGHTEKLKDENLRNDHNILADRYANIGKNKAFEEDNGFTEKQIMDMVVDFMQTKGLSG